MWNPEITFTGIAKTVGIMGIGAMTVTGWLWTGSAWKTEVDMKLDTLAANNIRIEKKMDIGFDKIDEKFDKIDKKIDRNFDLLITEIRSLKK